MSGRQHTVRFGAYELLVDARELWREGRRVRLAPQAMRILIELTAAPDTVVTREHLRSLLWPDGIHVDFEPSLNTAIRKLRAALGDDADRARYVQTVPGRGYRFIAPVHRITPGDPGAIGIDGRGSFLPAPSALAALAARRSPWRPRLPWPLPLPRMRHVAIGSALTLVGAASAIVVMALLFRPPERPPRVSIVLRAIPAEARADAASAALLDATLASLQVAIGRLDPAKLVVRGEASRSEDVCHELVASADAREHETRTRITIRLLNACRDEQIWAATADVGSSAQAEAVMVRAAGRAVADHLLDGERSARDAAATSSGAALDAYRRGQAASRAVGTEDLAVAIAAFDAALRVDPEFAPAWAALARARATRALRDGRDPSQFHQADAEALRALALDGDLADAHVAIAQVRFGLHRDAVGAEASLLRARALGATSARDRLWHVCVLNAQGRFDEALRVVDDAIANEPGLAVLHAWRGLVLHSLGRYEDELTALQRAASMDPRSAEAAFHLGMGYARRSRYELALPALRRAVVLSGEGAYYLSWFGRMAADAGDLPAAERVLRELREMAQTRGIAPALSGSVEHHIAVKRDRSGAL